MYDDRTFLSLKQISSVSMVQGAITGLVQELLKSRFTKNYFKNFYVSTSLASIREESSEESEERVVKENPILALEINYNISNRPIVEYPSLDRKFSFAKDIPEFIINSMDTLFVDETNLRVHFDMTRIKVDFQVSIRLESELEAWDVATYLNNIFRTERPFYLNNKVLPCQIPTTLMYVLAKVNGFDLNIKEDVNKFEKYLKIYSRDFISISRNLATGKDVAFFNLPVNLLVKPESSPEITKNNVNKSVDKSIVAFTLTVETNIPSTYIAKIPVIENTNIEIPDHIIDEGKNIKANIIFFKAAAPDVWNDKNLILFKGFITDNNTAITRINLHDILPDDVVEFIKVTKEDFTEVLLWIADNPLDSSDYRVLYDSSEVELFIPLKNVSYHIAIYIDLEKFKLFLNKQSEFKSYKDMVGD